MQPVEIFSLSPRDIFHIIFKHKFLILLIFLGTVCITVIVTFLVEPIYEAKAQFLVKLGRESIYVPEIGGANTVISTNRENQINSEIEILKSRSLAQKVVTALGPKIIYAGLGRPHNRILGSILHRDSKPQDLTKTALLKLQRNTEIRALRDSDIIEVYFKHTDPQIAATVLNEMAKHYLERHLSVHKSTRSHGFFRQQADHLKDKLSRNEARLQVLKEKYKVTSFEEQQRLLLSKIADLRSELDRTTSQIVETQNRVAHLQMQLAKTPETIAESEDVSHKTELINTLEARLVELQLRKKHLLAKYTDDNPLIQSVNEEIEMVKEKLTVHEGERYGTTHWGVNLIFQHLRQGLHNSEADLKSLEAKHDIQSTQLREYQEELVRLNGIEIEYRQRQQEVEVDRQNYRLYLTKFEESRISEAMDSEKIASVTLIEPVQVPIKPVSPRKSLNLALGVFLGTIGSLGLTFFLQYLNDSLETVESVENCLDVPVLISIPLKRYIYLEATRKADFGKNKHLRQQKSDRGAMDPEQLNTCLTRAIPDLTCDAEVDQSVNDSNREMWLPSPSKISPRVSPNGWYELHSKLLCRNQQGRRLRTLMFTGIDHGIGVTTAVVNFGRALAETSGRRVLIIDINLRTPRLHSIFKLNPDDGITELFLDNGVKTCAFKKVAEGQLSVITCGKNYSDGANYFERERIAVLIKEALDKFDFVILDTAPITKFADPQAICSLADGVLLVIQSGKTRPQQALRAKKELEDAGGKLLGVILNKRKYYIPEWIYRRF
jgi:capsular exopolysaccharide synthesis family protein